MAAKAIYASEQNQPQPRNTGVANRVIVKNLSPTTSEETIIIHFQRRKNGGGEVDSVRLLSEGVAVVTFEKPEVAESVLKRTHEIDGVLVTVERDNQISDQVFGKVAGRLDPHSFGVDFSSMGRILQSIKDETGVEWRKIFDGFVVSGTFEQIKKVHRLLKETKLTKMHQGKSFTQRFCKGSMIGDAGTTGQSIRNGKPLTDPTNVRKPSYTLETIGNIPGPPNLEKSHGRGKNYPVTRVNKKMVSKGELKSGHSEAISHDSLLSEIDVPGVGRISNNEKAQLIQETYPQSNGRNRPKAATSKVEDLKATGENKGKTGEVRNLAIELEEFQKSSLRERRQNGKEAGNYSDVNNPKIITKGKTHPEDSKAVEKHDMDNSFLDNASQTSQTELPDTGNTSIHTQGKTPSQEETNQQNDEKNQSTTIGTSVKKQIVLKDQKGKPDDARQTRKGVTSDPMAFRDLNAFDTERASTGGKQQDQEETKQHADDKNGLTKVGKREVAFLGNGGEGEIDKHSSEKSVTEVPKQNEMRKKQACSRSNNPKSVESIEEPESSISTMKNNHMKFSTSTGITVLLLKGGITNHNVDVLVSPANPSLCYKEGLSKLIQEKGGASIKDECLSITQGQETLKHGTTRFTDSGNLPCKAVLHTVLPPWTDDKEDKKELKRQIHRCLKGGLTLASGRRHRSVAFPPLGQDWNPIPVEVSAEVITRVIAGFSRNIGPLHSGVTDLHIVCEDDATLEHFTKELTEFSFPNEGPWFVISDSKNKLWEIASYRSAGKHRNKCEMEKSCKVKERSVQQKQQETLTPDPDFLVEKGNENVDADPKNVKTDTTSSEITLPQDRAVLDGSKEMKNLYESTNNVSFYGIESTVNELLEAAQAFEILEERPKTTSVQVVEGISKHVTAENNSKGDFGKNFNGKDCENYEKEVMESSEPSERCSAQDNANVMAEPQQPKLIELSTKEERIKNIAGKETSFAQSSTKDATNLCSLSTGQETLVEGSSSLSSLCTNNFVTSPTIETLLNVDLSLGVQGLQLMHDKNESMNRTENQDKRSNSFLHYQHDFHNGNYSIASSDPTLNEIQSNCNMEENTRKEINNNLPSNMGLETHHTASVEESIFNGDLVKAKDKGARDGCEPLPEKNVFTVSTEQPSAFLCALCQDKVDHPDLIHPDVCGEHKFCDDCILNVFTFSNNCPACMDRYGLITAKRADNVEHCRTSELDIKDVHPSTSDSSSPMELVGSAHWTTSRNLPANQPPGEMMWKTYADNLPGFEGCGTIVITFTFYDGVQSSEHPNPGGSYKGMSCMAYFPDTQEGRQILKLLRKAFDARLVFTVSQSASDGDGQVALNGVELKTEIESSARNGFPDVEYFSRLRRQLAAKGIC